MWIYYPLIIVIVGVILLFKWVDSAWTGRGDKGEKSDNREIKRYAIVFLFFILIGTATIPTMGNYWPLAEIVLVLFIPFFKWRDIVDAGRTEELKTFKKNMLRTTVAIAACCGIVFLLYFFSPVEQFKRAWKNRDYVKVEQIYAEMSERDQNAVKVWWKNEQAEEDVKNIIGDLF